MSLCLYMRLQMTLLPQVESPCMCDDEDVTVSWLTCVCERGSFTSVCKHSRCVPSAPRCVARTHSHSFIRPPSSLSPKCWGWAAKRGGWQQCQKAPSQGPSSPRRKHRRPRLFPLSSPGPNGLVALPAVGAVGVPPARGPTLIPS